ncbi:MAG: hypothetical protein FWH20_07220 [Oscillospiraceae bacterium]|nr:hypothetical protein [Oscillospiraceae bacterium]
MEQYTHSATARFNYLIQFDCEHCDEVNSQSHFIMVGSTDNVKSYSGNINTETAENLKQQAAENLQATLPETLRLLQSQMDNGKYWASNENSKCKSCGKYQTWTKSKNFIASIITFVIMACFAIPFIVFAARGELEVAPALLFLIPFGIFVAFLTMDIKRNSKINRDFKSLREQNKPRRKPRVIVV